MYGWYKGCCNLIASYSADSTLQRFQGPDKASSSLPQFTDVRLPPSHTRDVLAITDRPHMVIWYFA